VLADRGDGGVAAVGVAIDHHDLVAVPGEVQRRRPADAVAAAGDQRDPALEVHVRSSVRLAAKRTANPARASMAVMERGLPRPPGKMRTWASAPAPAPARPAT